MRSKHIKDTYTKMPKRVYLEGVRDRLINDVGTYYQKIDEEGSRGNMVGFWGSARLIFPVIEAVAKTIYRQRGLQDKRIVKLLSLLGIHYPNLVWQMYRHSLSHSDHLVHVEKGDKTISWSITASAGGISTGHIFGLGVIHIDTRRLYEDFINFLNSEIDSSTTNVYVKTGIKINSRYQGEIISEIKRNIESVIPT